MMYRAGMLDLRLEELAEIERRAGGLGERLDRLEATMGSNARRLDRLEDVAGKAAEAGNERRLSRAARQLGRTTRRTPGGL